MKLIEQALGENKSFPGFLKNIFMFLCLNTFLVTLYVGPSFYLSNLSFHFITLNDYDWYYKPFALSIIKSNYLQNIIITALWWFYSSYYCSSSAMKKYTRIILSTVITVHLLFMSAQYVSCHYGGSFLTTVHLENMEYIVLFWKSTAILLLLCGAVWFLCYKMLLLSTGVQTKRMLVLYMIIILVVAYGNKVNTRRSYVAYFPVPEASPYQSFYNEIIKPARAEKKELESVPEKITVREKLELQKYGIYLDGNSSKALGNRRKYKNIIVLFIESLSLDLVGKEYLGRRITPNIDAFMGKSITHKNYYNHATPTDASLRGQLYSEYVYTTVGDWYKHYTKDMFNYPATSLVDVLNADGYESTYVNYGLPEQSYNNILFKQFGFQRQFYINDILTGASLRNMRGTDDETVMNYVAKLVTGLKEKRKFIAVSTIGTHSPYSVNQMILEDTAPDSVNALYSLDCAYGEFLRQIEEEMDDTLLVLTADHAMVSGRGNTAVYKKEPGSYFDRVVMALWAPKNKNAAIKAGIASSLSLAPTILDLNGSDIPDSFAGRSLFDEAAAQQEKVLGIGVNMYSITRLGKTLQYKTGQQSKVPTDMPDYALIKAFVKNDRYKKWPHEFRKAAE